MYNRRNEDEEAEVIYNVNTTNAVFTVDQNDSSVVTKNYANYTGEINESQDTINSKADTREAINNFVTYSKEIEQ